MADLTNYTPVKVTELAEVTEINETNYIVITDGSSTKKIKAILLKGQNGVTPAFQIGTVSTLTEGSNATVNMSNHNGVYTINFGIPRGESGSGGASSGMTEAQLNQLSIAYGHSQTTHVQPAEINELKGIINDLQNRVTTLENQQSETVKVTGISLNNNTLTLNTGDTNVLTATVLPSNATNKNVTWTTNNSSVASVSNGVVTGLSTGTATIRATTEDGGYSATCTVTVKASTVSVQGVTLSANTLSIKVGGTSNLTANISPSNATNKNVTWSTNNSSVASVDNGTITGLSAGTAIITVTTVDGSYSATCAVNVSVGVTGVSLSAHSLTLKNGNTYTLGYTITPNNATNKNVTWSTNNNAIVSVSSTGLITAKSVGQASISVVTTDGNFIDSCVVTVEEVVTTVSVTGVTLSANSLSMKVGETSNLTANISPSNATNKNVTWSSNSTTVANVNNGIVTANSAGQATIRVRTEDGGYMDSCVVTVSAVSTTVNVTGVTLSTNTLSMKVGGTTTLIANIRPSNATNQNVTWSTNNGSVASVSNGVVTAKAKGQATITVRTADGGYSDTCIVTVSETTTTTSVTGVTLNNKTLTMSKIGGTQTLGYTITPSNATNKNVTWSTSVPTVASVNNGIITANANGTTVITIRTTDGGYTDTCTVTVNDTSHTGGGGDSTLYIPDIASYGISKDGTNSEATTNGLNRLFTDLNTSGKTNVQLPTGTYAINPDISLTPKSNLTLDLNGSKLKIDTNGKNGSTMIYLKEVEN